jgi:hypothetical protein
MRIYLFSKFSLQIIVLVSQDSYKNLEFLETKTIQNENNYFNSN